MLSKVDNSIVAFSLTKQISSKLLALGHHNRQVTKLGETLANKQS